MEISYLAPLERAWRRTERLLFAPFDVERWLVLGFAAFLAHLVGGWSGRAGLSGMGKSWSWSVAPMWIGWLDLRDVVSLLVFLPLVALGLVLALLLLWLSSRGRFVFLHDLVHGRAEIVAPWREHARLGNSLFVWSTGMLLAAVPVGVLFVSAAVAASRGNPLGILEAVALVLCATTLLCAFGIVALLLVDFVVPIMLRRRCSTNEAWRCLLPLLRARPLEFAGYVLVVVLARAAVAALLLLAGVATCCVLPLLLAIPYLGSLLLLPLTSLFRLYGVEFLSQLGPDLVPWPAVPPAAPPAAPATDSAPSISAPS